MIWLFITVILFLILLMLPVLLGLYWYYHSTNRVMFVRQNRTRDPRYFSNSFDKLFRRAWEDRKDGFLKLSKREPYQSTDRMAPSDYPQEVNTILVAEEKPFMPPENVHFTKEIFSFQNAKIPPQTHLRAIRSAKDMVLGRKTELDRWADAEGTLAIYDACNLGISASSPIALSVGRSCRFKRLYSPIIHAGAYPGDNEEPLFERSEAIYSLGEPAEQRKKSGHIQASDAPDGIANASFISQDKLIVDEDIIVQGSIRARNGIRLAERAVVCGNLFSDGDIYLSRNSTVLGNVFTQGSVYLETGSVVGLKDQIRSIIARDQIEIERDCFIYGYISAEGGGVIWKNADEDEAVQAEEETYLTRSAVMQTLVLADQETFDKAVLRGFRHSRTLRQVIITAPITQIPRSMFFDCRALESVILPETLEKIEEYAFADCAKLKTVNWAELQNLKQIGHGAFDGCDLLADKGGVSIHDETAYLE